MLSLITGLAIWFGIFAAAFFLWSLHPVLGIIAAVLIASVFVRVLFP